MEADPLTSSTSSSSSSSVVVKELYVLRHGQATHNPRAEAARENGCSWDEFLELMRQDDSLDAELTEWGHQQAIQVHENYQHVLSKLELVVSSPLSRALQTADGAAPDIPIRLVVENFREINGLLLNAQRRSRTELSKRFPNWCLDHLASDHDDQWRPDSLEDKKDCGERGYRGLSDLMHRQERTILLVAHGGLLRLVMAEHPNVMVHDERTELACSDNSNDACSSSPPRRDSSARFSNCELRRYRMEWRHLPQPRNSESDAAGRSNGGVIGNDSDRSVEANRSGGDAVARKQLLLLLTELDIPKQVQ